MALAARNPDPTPTAHPYVVRTPGLCGGRPHLRNTRIPVSAVAELLHRGETAFEIAISFGPLDPGVLADALLYYADNREEIDAEIAADAIESALAHADAVLGEDGVIRFHDRTG
jgi:uncharacterized protein (DUF433 family)